MRPTTRMVLSISILFLVVSIVGAIISIAAGWPAQFGGPGDPDNVASEFVYRGTALAAPLFPIIVLLVVFNLLVLSQRWWGTVGVVGLCLLAVLMFIGSLGEAFAPHTPAVPRLALVISGVVGVVLSVALLGSGVMELIDRGRAGRQHSRVS